MKSLLAQVRVPGKLLLLGEYAILEPGSQALVLSVNRWLELQLYPAEAGLILESDISPGIRWSSSAPGSPLQAVGGPALPFVDSALALAAQWLQEAELPFQPLHLVLHSQLQQAGQKLGLGSSAAVTVAVLAGVLAAHGQILDTFAGRLTLFKLAVLAHGQVQRGGSGADLAGCIFGSVTCYRRFDPHWLETVQLPLRRLLAMDWPLLGLEKLPWPKELALLVGWSGVSANTVDYLAEFAHVKEAVPEEYQRFLFSANAATSAGRDALRQGQYQRLGILLSQYRRLLQELQQHFLAPIETPELKTLLDLAEVLGLGAKSSGAGGGDCGLALGTPDHLAVLAENWRQQGLPPLDMQPETQGLIFGAI